MTNPEDLAQALAERLHERTVNRAELHPYVLVDGALLPAAWHELSLVERRVVVPDRIRAAPSEHWALPALVAFPTDVLRRQAMLLRTARWALQSHAVSWLVSPLNIDALAAALAARSDVQLPDNHRAILRVADTRVLPVLRRVLDAQQAAAYFRLARGWWHLDRRCELVEIELPTEVASPEGHESRWLLDDRQQAAMIDAAEPDAVLALLREHDPEGLRKLTRSEEHGYVVDAIEAAKRWKIDSTRDCAIYCMLTLELGACFDAKVPWSDTMDEVMQRKLSLTDAVQRHEGEAA